MLNREWAHGGRVHSGSRILHQVDRHGRQSARSARPRITVLRSSGPASRREGRVQRRRDQCAPSSSRERSRTRPDRRRWRTPAGDPRRFGCIASSTGTGKSLLLRTTSWNGDDSHRAWGGFAFAFGSDKLAGERRRQATVGMPPLLSRRSRLCVFAV